MPGQDFPLPNWIRRLPKAKRKQATQRFLLRLAALYASDVGTLRRLSMLCGYAPHTFGTLACREQMSPDTARKIEALLGAGLFPRERLCPRVFADGEATRPQL